MNINHLIDEALKACNALEFQDADRLLRKVKSLDPSNPRVFFAISYFAKAAGNNEAAKRAIEKSIMLGGSSDEITEFYNNMINPEKNSSSQSVDLNDEKLVQYYEAQKYDEIIKWAKVHAETLQDGNVLNIIGASYMALHMQQEAAKYFEHAYEKSNRDDILYNLGVCLVALQKLDRAKRIFESIKVNQPALSYYNLALISFYEGSYSQALNYFDTAHKQGYTPQWQIRMGKANCYNKLSELEKAEEHYLAATSKNKQSVILNYTIAEFYRKWKKNTKASKFYQRVLDQCPENLPAKIGNYRVNSKAESGWTPDAITSDQLDLGTIEALVSFYLETGDLEHALSIIPDRSESIYLSEMKIKIYLHLMSWDNLKTVCEDLLNKQKENYQANLALAIYHNSNFEHRAALDVLKKLDKQFPNDPSVRISLASTYNKAGCFAESAKILLEQLKRSPSLTLVTNIYFPLRVLYLTNNQEALEILNTLREALLTDHPYLFDILNFMVKIGTSESEIAFQKALRSVGLLKKNIVDEKVQKHEFENLYSSQPAALFHFGRSGTGLIHSLIDGHNEISTIPSVFLSEFFNQETVENLSNNDPNTIFENLYERYQVLFDTTSKKPVLGKSGKLIYNIGENEGLTKLGDNRDQHIFIDKNDFKTVFVDTMSSKDKTDHKAIFESLHRAYDYCTSDVKVKKSIFYHIHNPDPFSLLNYLDTYPHGKLLVAIREPLQSVESWMTKAHGDCQNQINRLVGSLFEIDAEKYKSCDSVGIKLEDLKLYPEQTLDALSEWLGVNFQPSMLKMTANGMRWWGDPSSPNYHLEGSDPFGTAAINRKKSGFFNEKDLYRLDTLFYPFKKLFSYSCLDEEQFQHDLCAISTIIDDLFLFETNYIVECGMGTSEYQKSNLYHYLRVNLRLRLDTLIKHGTYPEMIRPLRVRQG